MSSISSSEFEKSDQPRIPWQVDHHMTFSKSGQSKLMCEFVILCNMYVKWGQERHGRSHETGEFDIFEPRAFKKCSICWVLI